VREIIRTQRERKDPLPEREKQRRQLRDLHVGPAHVSRLRKPSGSQGLGEPLVPTSPD
jgi:hypothetical protein